MSMTLKQILKRAPITVREDDELGLALQVMVWGNVHHLPVLKNETVVGLLSERDVLRRYSEVGRKAGAREKVQSAMSQPVITARATDDVAVAAKAVTAQGIGCLPVLDHGRLVGVVTRRDLLLQELSAVEDAVASEERSKVGLPWSHLTVDDVMSPEPITAAADDALMVAIDRMGRHGIRHLPIVDAERNVIGMLSDRDVRTAIGNPMRSLDRRDAVVRIESTRVSSAMTRAPITLVAGTRLSRAAAVFADSKVGAVPIVDTAGRLVGVVSHTDVLRALLGPKREVS